MVEQVVAFWYLAIMAVGAGFGVLLFRNPVHAALSLVFVIFHVAGLFVILGAGFLAAVQVIVYAGAIVVLFLFTLMMLDMRHLPDERIHHRQAWLGIPLAIVLAVEAVFVGVGTPEISDAFRGVFAPQSISELGGSTQALASVLFTEYLLPFEVASVLLLVGALGAIVLARRFDDAETSAAQEALEAPAASPNGAGDAEQEAHGLGERTL